MQVTLSVPAMHQLLRHLSTCLQVLRMPLFQLPQLITQLVNAQVAINRLSEFLAAEQKPPEELLEPAAKGTVP